MAEGPPAEAAGHRPAFEFEAGCEDGRYYINVKIDNPWLAVGIAGAGMGAGVVTLGAFYLANPVGTEAAVRSVFTTFAEVLGITVSSLLVKLCFHTKESFLSFMNAFEKKTIKQRLQEELLKIGFEDELEVTIVNEREVYDNLNLTR